MNVLVPIEGLRGSRSRTVRKGQYHIAFLDGRRSSIYRPLFFRLDLNHTTPERTPAMTVCLLRPIRRTGFRRW
jgi:hypothetical protein